MDSQQVAKQNKGLKRYGSQRIDYRNAENNPALASRFINESSPLEENLSDEKNEKLDTLSDNLSRKSSFMTNVSRRYQDQESEDTQSEQSLS